VTKSITLHRDRGPKATLCVYCVTTGCLKSIEAWFEIVLRQYNKEVLTIAQRRMLCLYKLHDNYKGQRPSSETNTHVL